MTGLLYQFFSILIDQANSEHLQPMPDYSKETYVTQVMDFIEMNYANAITVQSIANFMSVCAAVICALSSRTRWEAVFSRIWFITGCAEYRIDP